MAAVPPATTQVQLNESCNELLLRTTPTLKTCPHPCFGVPIWSLAQALASAQAQLNERSDELIIRSQRVKTLEQQLEEVEETHRWNDTRLVCRQDMQKIHVLEDKVKELNMPL
eukprot:1157509-Pelagomonas_calceolata.AAC.1